MILVDPAVGSKELLPLIIRIGYAAQIAQPALAYGDFAFDGNGPKGPISVAIERKSLHDMLHCIDDSRYAGFQKGGMDDLFNLNFLIVEGQWKPHEPDGYLMEGRGNTFWPCRYRSQTSPYSKLFNYLISVSLSRVIVIQTRDMYQTAYNICCMYDYFQKPWGSHTSMFETQVLPLADIGGKPSLVRRWAAQIDGIGVKLSRDAEHIFKSARELANGDEMDWARIKGISVQTAQRIVKEIWVKR